MSGQGTDINKRIRFQPLEPRILLDAAAVATVADTTADLDQQNELHNLIQTAIVRDPQTEARNNNPGSANTAAGTFQLEVRPVATDGEPVTLSAEIESSALVVIDTSIHGYEDLLADLEPDIDILLIDRNENGLQKLADYVEGRDDISSIHILSHGAEGEFTLGSVTINADNIDQHAELLGQIGESLTENGDLLLYGCNVADDGTSIEFVNKVADYTEADVAVSTNLTGAAALGGDWDLEHTIGQIDAANLELNSFSRLLAPPTATDDTATTDEDTPLTTTATTNLLDNDTDPDGDSLSITQVRSTFEPDSEANFEPDPEANNIQPTDVVHAMISPVGDVDYWQFTLTESGVVTLETSGSTDTLGLLQNAIGTPLAEDDDSGARLNFQIQETLPAGTYYIRVTGYAGNVGDYTLSLDFEPGPDTSIGRATAGSNGGQFTINADGSWSFNPGTDFDDLAADATRATSITYTVSDGNGGTDTATLMVTVTGVNDAPVAFDDRGRTHKDGVLTVPDGADGSTDGYNADLLLNDIDPNGDTLSITEVDGDTANLDRATEGTNGGQFTINADGSWNFNPGTDFDDLAADASRTTSITYTGSDGNGGTDTAILRVIVNGFNDAPVAADDQGRTHNDRVLIVDGWEQASGSSVNYPLLYNDNDLENDPLSITAVGSMADSQTTANVGQPIEGTGGGGFTVSADGTYRFDPGTDFDGLAAGATRTTSVVYTVSDGHGNTDTATLTVAVGDFLITTNDRGRTGEDSILTVPNNTTGRINADGFTENADLLLNDLAPQGGTLSITEVNGDPDNLGRTTAGYGGSGEFTINADGSWSFDPGVDFQRLSQGDQLTTGVDYTVSDGLGGTDRAFMWIQVSGANDPPEASDDFSATDKDSVLTAPADTLLLNDQDIDRGDTLSITAVSSATANVGTATRGSHGGQFTVSADGSWHFDPDGDFDDLASSDTRTTSVTYTLSDNHDATDTATLFVLVYGGNAIPSATDDTGSTDEDTLLTVADGATGRNGNNADLLLNDSDPDGDPLSITSVQVLNAYSFESEPVSPGARVRGTAGGEFIINTGGSWRFDPNGDFDDLAVGETRDTFAFYVVSDDQGGADFATLAVTVTGVNDALTANDDFGRTLQDRVLTVPGAQGLVNANLLLNDIDPDGDLGIIAVNGNADSLYRATAGTGGGDFTIDADGFWRFDPVDDFNDLVAGASRDTSVTYTVSDGDRQTDTATLTVTVRGGTNQVPTADGESDSTDEDTPLTATVNLLDNDSDPDGDALGITHVGSVAGMVAAANVGKATEGSHGGQFTVNADGSWRFHPGGGFDDLAASATRTTSVTYTVFDGHGGTATATLTVTVTGVNDAPTAGNDLATTDDRDMPLSATANLLVNDSDPDGGSLRITSVGGDADNLGRATEGSHGGQFTVNADGSWAFDPGTDFDDLAASATRETRVTYTLSDGHGGTDTATLTVAVGDFPNADDDTGTTDTNTVLTVADNAGLLLNDSDPQGDPLTITQVLGFDAMGQPETVFAGAAIAGSNGGTFTIRADGSWVFDPGTDFDDLAAGATRDTSITYIVSDRRYGSTDTATLTVTVRGVGGTSATGTGGVVADGVYYHV